MGETTTTDACSRHIRAKSQGRPPRMSGSQPTRRNGLPTTISPTTAPVPEPATLRRVPDAPAEAADEEQFHAWRMPFPGHDRRRPTRIERRFTARGRPDSRDVFRAISENDAGRGRVGVVRCESPRGAAGRRLPPCDSGSRECPVGGSRYGMGGARRSAFGYCDAHPDGRDLRRRSRLGRVEGTRTRRGR
jgi:hypothetical protein